MVRSKGRSGLNPRAYLGVEAPTPPNIILQTRAPLSSDSKNVNIGDLWLHYRSGFPAPGTANDLYFLVSLERDVAKWVNFLDDAGLNTLTGNTGGAVSPDAMDNIDVIGNTSVNLTIAGNPAMNRLTVTSVSTNPLASDFVTDAGTALPTAAGVLTIFTDNVTNAAGATVLFTGVGSTVQLQVTDADTNTLIGNNAGNLLLAGQENTGIGDNALNALTNGSSNTAVGQRAGSSITFGDENVAIGVQSLENLTAGRSNTAVGYLAGSTLTGGDSNILIGRGAGFNLTGLEVENIYIGTEGVAADNSVIRLGELGVQDECYIQGIAGVTVANQQNVVIDSVTGQLGTGGGASASTDYVTDAGTATPNGAGMLNVLTNFATQEAGSTVLFSAPGASNTILLSVTDGSDNTLIGFQSGNATLTGARNTALGNDSLRAITSSNDTTALGNRSLLSLTSGIETTAVGASAAPAVTTGAQNTALGYLSLALVDTGSNNVCVGRGAGITITGASSDNIYVGRNVSGVGVENNTIRLGILGTQTRNFQAGIAGVTVGNQQNVVIDSTTGQLGSAPLPSGGSVAGTARFLAQQPTTAAVVARATTYFLGTNPTGIMTEVFDPDAVFFPGDGAALPALYTAPATGVYQFGYRLTLAFNILLTYFSIGIVINGDTTNAYFSQSNNEVSGNARVGVNADLEVIIPLNAGDQVEFGLKWNGSPTSVAIVNNVAGSTSAPWTGSCNWVWGYRVG